MITKEAFGDLEMYTLANGILEVKVINLGATVTSIKYKGTEQILNYETAEEYHNDTYHLAKMVGRYGNRIGNACFPLNGEIVHLTPNENGNQLHGGPNSLGTRIWDVKEDGDNLICEIFSPDGDNGFPGNLTMRVIYSLNGHGLHIEFEGETDKPTVFAPTFHPYFLTGGNCLDAKLQINAKEHLDVDEELIPTGKLLECEGKFDFTKMKKVESDLDDCFVTPDDYAVTLESEKSTMELWTNFPAVQVYTGIWLKEPFTKNYGIAIEPEAFPDSPNKENFPDVTLNPGETFRKWAEYKFF